MTHHGSFANTPRYSTQPVAGFFVEGEPKPQGSMRSVGKGRMIPDNPHMKKWRDHVQAQATQVWGGKDPLDQPVEVHAVFWLPSPKKPRFSVPATGYDTDKLQRAIGDALERGGVLRNDARITTWIADKRYATAADPAGVHITIYTKEDA